MVEVIAQLSSVSVSFDTPRGQVRALDGVDLDLAAATSIAVLGRSGSGKSTLISALALMRRPTEGTYLLLGDDTARLDDERRARRRGRDIGIVFQAFHLDASLSARDNVLLPWYFDDRRIARNDAVARVSELLEELEIADLSDRRPNEMSGGQKQRVAIARAMFHEPSLFIADEPTGSLDEDTANAVADTIMALPQRHGTTVVVVTHDRIVAQRAQRQLHLVRGRLDEQADP